MNVALIVFSQSGNTLRVAETIADVFRGCGHIVHLQLIKDPDPFDPHDYDLLGVGSACFHGKAPTPMKQFLHTLPSVEGKLVFVFTTSGGAPGRILRELAQILREKGARVLGGLSIIGKIYHPSPSFFGRNPNRPSPHDLARCKNFALEIERISSSEARVQKPLVYSDTLETQLRFYDLFSYISSDPVLRWMMPAPEPETDHCQRCGICADLCPMHNIILGPAPRSLGRCIRCYHCLAVCPSRARSVRWNRRSQIVEALYSPRMVRRFGGPRIDERRK